MLRVSLLLLLLMLTGCQRAALHCDTAFTPIATIQGIGETSPLLGKQLITRGVVLSAIYTDSPKPGIVLQSLQADNDPRTAEGLFISLTEPERFSHGEVLLLQGTVAEIDQMTSLVDVSLIESCGTHSVTPQEISLPLPAELNWEALEGMWLRFIQPLVINDTYQLGRYGEILLADKRLMVPTQVVLPGEPARQRALAQERRSVVLDDGLWQQNPDPLPSPFNLLSAVTPIRLGDTLQNVEGILVQDQRGFRLVPTQTPQLVQRNPRPAPPQATAPRQLRVASFNVLNFFTGADQPEAFPTRRGARSMQELARQQAKLVSAILLMDADIIGLNELENNGYDNGSAIATLVAALNTQTERPYAIVRTNETPGTDHIKVGIIYRPDTVQTVGQPATQTQAPFHQLHRPPVAASFKHRFSEQPLTVVVNHFKSKGSCPRENAASAALQGDQGDGQACWNAARLEASQGLQQWLQSNPTGINSNYQLLLGDLNTYRMEDPIRYLEQAGWHYLSSSEAEYSYTFRGRSGSLDHALASPALAARLAKVTHWSINADEAVLLDYSSRFKPASLAAALYADNPFRSSDHDPVIVSLQF
ncbi:ExeM/NucH family extracellular endonuclease [Arsukibacterium sp.]|uniref:ExeM/NucH family extracellular endonuclease n=1 Tax=Arsukibacterium sp. TaxID=1977258 RepID=UPI002FD9C10D